jgi:hypothetical protein
MNMSVKTGISRRQFLGATAAVAGVAALPSIVNVTEAVAADAVVFPLATSPWTPLDAKALARQGYEIYKGKWAGQSACCEASYWPVIGALGTAYPSTWGLLSKGVFNYGGGGVNAWGSICGCPNGITAMLTQMGAPTNVKDNFLRWYEKTALPSNAAYEDFATGTWTPGGSATAGWGDTFTAGATQLPTPLNNVPRSQAQSILCHTSLQMWRVASDQWMLAQYPGKDTQSDRCGKLVYDAVYYAATLINQWKAGTPAIDGSVSPAASATGCKNASCHGQVTSAYESCDGVTVQGKMNCSPCHTL